MIHRKTQTSSGFMALMAAIIISVILLLITTNLSLTSFYGRSNILDSEFKEKSSALAEACADTAILKLVNNAGYAGGEDVFIGSDKCTIQSVSGGTINVKADYKNYITKLKIVVNPNMSVDRWEEI